MLVVVYEQCVMSFRVKGDPGIHSVARLASAKKVDLPEVPQCVCQSCMHVSDATWYLRHY